MNIKRAIALLAIPVAALAFVPVLHWLVLDRNLAVSGRVTALVDRVRLGPVPVGAPLPDVAVHVVQAERVRREAADGATK